MSVLRQEDLTKGHTKLHFQRLQKIIDSTQGVRFDMIQDIRMKLQIELDRLVEFKDQEEELFNHYNILDRDRMDHNAGEFIKGQFHPDPYGTEPGFSSQERGIAVMQLENISATSDVARLEGTGATYSIPEIALAQSDYMAKLGPSVRRQIERIAHKIKMCRLNAERHRLRLERLVKEKERSEAGVSS